MLPYPNVQRFINICDEQVKSLSLASIHYANGCDFLLFKIQSKTVSIIVTHTRNHFSMSFKLPWFQDAFSYEWINLYDLYLCKITPRWKRISFDSATMLSVHFSWV